MPFQALEAAPLMAVHAPASLPMSQDVADPARLLMPSQTPAMSALMPFQAAPAAALIPAQAAERTALMMERAPVMTALMAVQALLRMLLMPAQAPLQSPLMTAVTVRMIAARVERTGLTTLTMAVKTVVTTGRRRLMIGMSRSAMAAMRGPRAETTSPTTGMSLAQAAARTGRTVVMIFWRIGATLVAMVWPRGMRAPVTNSLTTGATVWK